MSEKTEILSALKSSLQILNQTKKHREINGFAGGNIFMDSTITEVENAIKICESTPSPALQDSVKEKLRNVVKVFAKIMFYGGWKWENPNERVITMLMQELELYPFKNEDEMIIKTDVSEELYKEAQTKVPTA